jgi:hypothetical protein
VAKVKDVSQLSDKDKAKAEALKRGAGPMNRAIATLRVLVLKGGSCTHDDVARDTQRVKGNELRALRIAGLVTADDSEPAPLYTITGQGRDFLQRHG